MEKKLDIILSVTVSVAIVLNIVVCICQAKYMEALSWGLSLNWCLIYYWNKIRCRERDCIDVQQSDYGYEEAVDKACQYLRYHIDPNLTIYHNGTWCSLDKFIDKFKQAMEQ